MGDYYENRKKELKVYRERQSILNKSVLEDTEAYRKFIEKRKTELAVQLKVKDYLSTIELIDEEMKWVENEIIKYNFDYHEPRETRCRGIFYDMTIPPAGYFPAPGSWEKILNYAKIKAGFSGEEWKYFSLECQVRRKRREEIAEKYLLYLKALKELTTKKQLLQLLKRRQLQKKAIGGLSFPENEGGELSITEEEGKLSFAK